MSEWINIKDKYPNCDSIQYIGDIKSPTQSPREHLSDKYYILEAGLVHHECKLWMPLLKLPEAN